MWLAINTSEGLLFFLHGLWVKELGHAIGVLVFLGQREILPYEPVREVSDEPYLCVRETLMKIPDNQEVLDWFGDLKEKYEDAKSKIDPVLTYIDNRVAHHNRKWNKKLIRSTARDIETAFESVNAYNNAFRVFYENGETSTMIGDGEIHAGLFLRVYYSCQRLNNLKNDLPEVLGDSPEDLQKAFILSQY